MGYLAGKLLRMLLWITGIAVGVFLIFSAFLYFQQHKLIFFPSRDIAQSPADWGMGYEDVRVEVAPDQRLHGWYFPVSDTARTIVLCHGNAGNISHRIESAAFWVSLGANVLLFDYRGYGKSEGSPGENECYEDVSAVLAWLRDQKNTPPDRVILFGRSLGGAVAIEAATRARCAGLVVESSFTSAADMGRRMYPFLPIGLLIKYRFDSLSKIGRVSCPVLVTHSPHDEIVPFDMGQMLYDAAPAPKRFVELVGGHNDRGYFDIPAYRAALQSLIRGTADADFIAR
jgi:fermentation-respiration switch protein FrsA (DUF1100 family)